MPGGGIHTPCVHAVAVENFAFAMAIRAVVWPLAHVSFWCFRRCTKPRLSKGISLRMLKAVSNSRKNDIGIAIVARDDAIPFKPRIPMVCKSVRASDGDKTRELPRARSG